MKFFMCFWKFCIFFHTNQSLQPYKQPSNDVLEYTELLKAKNFRESVWSEIEASQSFSGTSPFLNIRHYMKLQMFSKIERISKNSLWIWLTWWIDDSVSVILKHFILWSKNLMIMKLKIIFLMNVFGDSCNYKAFEKWMFWNFNLFCT